MHKQKAELQGELRTNNRTTRALGHYSNYNNVLGIRYLGVVVYITDK